MGVYTRADSPYYWLALPRPGQKPLRVKTKIHTNATTKQARAENRALAQAEYHERMVELGKGRLALPETHKYAKPFNEFADWFQTHELPKRRGRARELDVLKILRRYFRNTPLPQITRARVSEYETFRLSEQVPDQRKLEKDDDAPKRPPRYVTARTVNREVDLLKSILRVAAEHGHCPAGQLTGRKRLHAPRPVKVRMTPEDEIKIFKELAAAPADYALLLMGLDTLARLSDILDFQRPHDHGTSLTIVDPKNGRQLEVPISTRLRAALDAVPTDPTGSPYVFWHRRVAKNPRDWPSSVRQMLESACKRAGVPYGRVNQAITFHAATRRTAASRMLARGADIETVRSLGGWRDLRSVQDYVIAEDDNRKRAIALIESHAPITPPVENNDKHRDNK